MFQNRHKTIVCQETTVSNDNCCMLYLRWWNLFKTNHQSRCIGDGFKPPKGAVVNSYGIERLGESNP